MNTASWGFSIGLQDKDGKITDLTGKVMLKINKRDGSISH